LGQKTNFIGKRNVRKINPPWDRRVGKTIERPQMTFETNVTQRKLDYQKTSPMRKRGCVPN